MTVEGPWTGGWSGEWEEGQEVPAKHGVMNLQQENSELSVVVKVTPKGLVKEIPAKLLQAWDVEGE